MITLKSRVRICEDVVHQILDDETIILNIHTGIYFGLDESGTEIWQLLEQHGNVETVYKTLIKEYDVTEEQCRNDLLELIENLHTEGLIEVHE